MEEEEEAACSRAVPEGGTSLTCFYVRTVVKTVQLASEQPQIDKLMPSLFLILCRKVQILTESIRRLMNGGLGK
jgi:hypothetical protein